MVNRMMGLCLVFAVGYTGALSAATVQMATLKDVQPVGSTTKKQKHQQYDLVIDTTANEYSCRSNLGERVKPTQFVVGSTVEFKLSGQNGEATSPEGKHVKCGIVRVATLPAVQ